MDVPTVNRAPYAGENIALTVFHAAAERVLHRLGEFGSKALGHAASVVDVGNEFAHGHEVGRVVGLEIGCIGVGNVPHAVAHAVDGYGKTVVGAVFAYVVFAYKVLYLGEESGEFKVDALQFAVDGIVEHAAESLVAGLHGHVVGNGFEVGKTVGHGIAAYVNTLRGCRCTATQSIYQAAAVEIGVACADNCGREIFAQGAYRGHAKPSLGLQRFGHVGMPGALRHYTGRHLDPTAADTGQPRLGTRHAQACLTVGVGRARTAFHGCARGIGPHLVLGKRYAARAILEQKQDNAAAVGHTGVYVGTAYVDVAHDEQSAVRATVEPCGGGAETFKHLVLVTVGKLAVSYCFRFHAGVCNGGC